GCDCPDAKADADGAADETTIFDETLKCAMCMDLCSRPVTVNTINQSKTLWPDGIMKPINQSCTVMD
ncbi:hypothetical protein ACMWQD_29640, partial [Escherichia coli]|uniref:hypothetical protein n=1 Tax=Escherichia coli TaxID=562 RepID=UPI0039E0E0A8